MINLCVCVFDSPWGHVNNHAHIWALVTSMGSPDINARFWLAVEKIAALWLVGTYRGPIDYCPSIKSPFLMVSSLILLRSFRVYIRKQLCFSISVNSGWIFSSPFRGLVNVRPLFTEISKNDIIVNYAWVSAPPPFLGFKPLHVFFFP